MPSRIRVGPKPQLHLPRGGGLRLVDAIEVKSNLILTARERGKIVARREGHNIWLNLGREWLANLIGYQAYTGGFSPYTGSAGYPVPGLNSSGNNLIRYMGLGIGGTQQTALAVANSAPLVTAYPGTNQQTDVDPTVTRLERPVRISGGSSPYPGAGGDVWLGQLAAPATNPYGTVTQTQFTVLFGAGTVSYNPFLSVPVSEVGLFTNAANPLVYNNTCIAYDTADTISITSAVSLSVQWVIRF